MKIVAPHDRPREKLERVGAGGLGDNELLAIVLGHGDARGPVRSSSPTRCSPPSAACTGSPARRTDDLRRVPGIGARAGVAADRRGRGGPPHAGARRAASASQIMAARDAAELLVPQFGARPVEQFGVSCSTPSTASCGRRCCRSARSTRASSIRARCSARPRAAAPRRSCVFHNHPSGDPTPSERRHRPDEAPVTRGRPDGDHRARSRDRGGERFFSLRERGSLK